jgi:4-amino-4-deoxy-L-arabinose transferase-like glycosyltransferase
VSASRWRWSGDTAVVAFAALVTLVLLGLQLTADPATGFSFSDGPFTDEGFSVLGARNQALLGRFATDDWQLWVAQLPFNVVVAAVFEAFGVGIIQARLVSLLASVGAVALLTGFTLRHFGRAGALVAGIGLASSSLWLYYGRLAMLEPMETFFLVLGFVLLLSPRRPDRLAPWGQGVLGGVALALAIGIKPSAAIEAAGILLAVLVAVRPMTDGGSRFLGAGAAIAVAGLAWLGLVMLQPATLAEITRVWPQQSLPASLPEALARMSDYLRGSDGAIPHAAPLLVAGTLGAVLSLIVWRRLDGPQRALLVGAVAWFAFGMLALLLVPYRPNRYVVPLLPPLAVLAGAGMHVASRGLRGRALPVAAALALGLSLAGLRDVVRWTAAATYRLPAIQERVAAAVGDSAAVQGSVTFGMRVRAPMIVVHPGVNDGDLYATHHVRWLLVNPNMVPTWAPLHPDAWEARQMLFCDPWPSGEACLIRVP